MGSRKNRGCVVCGKATARAGEERGAPQVRDVDKVTYICDFKALPICKILGHQGHHVVGKVMPWRLRSFSSCGLRVICREGNTGKLKSHV